MNRSVLPFIPVCEPTLQGNEEKYVMDAVKSSWIGSQGLYLDRLNKEFPQYLGVKFGTAVSNGTTALHLACTAIGIGPGDEVVIPDFTMIASAFAVAYTGAKPVFVDCMRDSWNMNIAQVEEKITSKTKAIMAVHIYGLATPMEELLKIAKRHHLKVIEDAAEVHGSEYFGRKCGAFGDIAAFSFFANKNITCGEGGFVVTSDEDLYKKCLYYKNLCFPMDRGRVYEHHHIGFNYRMTNLHAAVAVAQLERIDDLIEARRKNARLYNKYLAEIPGITLPIEPPNYKNTYWMYSIVLEDEFGMSRDALMSTLRDNNIDSRAFFVPMHQQPSLIKIGCREAGSQFDSLFPVSCEISKKGLYLPSASHLKASEIERICTTIAKIREGV